MTAEVLKLFSSRGRRFISGAALSLALCILLPGSAAALEPGVRFGYGRGHSADEAVPSIGFFIGADLPGPVNLEFAGDFWRDEGEGGRIEVDNLPLQLSLRLFPLPSILVRPYLVGGAGIFLARIREKTPFGSFPEESSLHPSLHGGAGLEIPLAGLASLRAEGRYTRVREIDTRLSGEGHDPGGWRFFGALSFSF